MEPKYNSSFIPKKFLTDNVSPRSGGTQFVERRSVMGPGYYISVLIFVLALFACAGVFAYVKVTQQSITSLIGSLRESTSQINVLEIESFVQLDRRFDGAEELLNNHIALSGLLTALEEQTLKNVQLTALTYASGEGGDAQSITLSGETLTLQEVALQAEQFRSTDLLHTPVVTSIKRTEEGMIGFEMKVGINPKLVSYGTVLERGRPRGASQASVQPLPPKEQQDQATSSPQVVSPSKVESEAGSAVVPPPLPPSIP